MAIDVTTEAPEGPFASWDTAISCLIRLGAQQGLEAEVATLRSRSVPDSDTLSISRLVELARECGLQPAHARLDWPGLQRVGFNDPILVLLKNTNVVVLTGGGRDDAEEVAVWDPLHRDAELLFVPRQEFERAWTGDALTIAPNPATAPPAPLGPRGLPFESETVIDSDNGNETLPAVADIASEPLSPRPLHPEQALDPPSARRPGARPLSQIVHRCFVFAGFVASLGFGVFLFVHLGAENDAAPRGPVSEAFERTAEGTSQINDAPAETVPPAEVASTASVPAAAANPDKTSNIAIPAPATAPNEPASGVSPPTPTPRPDAVAAATPATPAPPLETPPAMTAPRDAAPPPASTPASPVSATAPAAGSLSAPEIEALLARGDKSFSSGDVASARLYYGRAAEAGDGQAAIRLGETFDPGFLERAHLRSARGDLATALSWYRRARDLGAAEAEILLNTPEAK
jgi:hypothetical protein